MKKVLTRIFQLPLLVVIFSTCNDKEEHYAIEPHIEFTKVEFIEMPGLYTTDTLKIVFSLTDGDSDFGLDNEGLEFVSYPYNQRFFFQANNGLVDTLFTTAATSSSGTRYDILDIPSPNKGRLVFPRTRKMPGYESLPAYNCYDYEYVGIYSQNLLIEAGDAAALDQKVRVVDTLKSSTTTYYHIQDTLLSSINPNHYNVEVDFLIENGQGFEEFDWAREFCVQIFDGRVSVESNGPFKVKKLTNNKKEITYNMTSIGFILLFSNKKMKLRIQVKDRALHRSNTIETPEFFLKDI